jgi:hypothetical protein
MEIPPDVQFDRSNDFFGLVRSTNFTYDFGATGKGYCRIFRHRDVVFKKNVAWFCFRISRRVF